jgi:hypothetical protein
MENPIYCKKCTCVYRTKNQLNHHIYNSHIRLLQVQCDLCGNYLKNKWTLLTHMKMHFK